MKMPAFLLRSGAVLLLLLLSISAHAIAIDYSKITLAQGKSADNTGIDSIPGVVSKTDQMIVLLLVSLHTGGQDSEAKLLSMGNSPDGFALLFDFPSAPGLQWPDGNLASFPAFGLLPDDADDADQMTRVSNEENEIIDFLAMLGIVTAVWEPSSEHSSEMADAAPPVVAGGVRRGARDACLHLHNEQSNKHGWHESLCPDTGLAGPGFSGTRIGRGGIVTSGGGVSGPSGSSIPGGVGGGSPGGGGTGSGGTVGGGTGGAGEAGGGGPGSGPGGENGSGVPGPGSGGGGTENAVPPSEVRTVPEPATLALVVFGLLGMYAAGYRNRGSASFSRFT